MIQNVIKVATVHALWSDKCEAYMKQQQKSHSNTSCSDKMFNLT